MSEDVAPSDPSVDDAAPIAPVPSWLRSLIAPFWIAAVALGTGWFLLDDQGFWFWSGAACCLVVSIPLMRRDYDLMSPWTVIVVAVYISTGLRGLFIALEIEGGRSINELFLLGRDEPYYYRPAVLFILALAMLVVGYMTSGRLRPRPSRSRRATSFNSTRVTIAVIVCAAIGLAALVQFGASTGGFSLSSLSAKRTTISGLNLSSTYQSSGQWRILNQFAPIALWVQLAHYAKQGARISPLTPRGVWVGLLFLNAVALPIYASSRADIVYIVLGALVVQLALRPESISLRPVLTGSAVALILISILTTARGVAAEETSDGSTGVSSQALIDAFVLSRTFTDIPATGNIINAVPDRLPYASGETIAGWAVAPIPRSVWPDKPIVSAGPTIGILIYGNERSGVPPGMIAESYWNFGVAGIVVLPILCGVFLRVLGERWRSRSKVDPGAAVLMAGVAMPTGVYLMTNSIGSAPFQALIALILLVPVVAFVRDRGPARARAHRGSRAHSVQIRGTFAEAQLPLR